MDNIKTSAFYKVISLALIITFISLDIIYASPLDYNTNNSTLAARSLMQQPADEQAAQSQRSLFSHGALLASVYDIGEYFFGRPEKETEALPSKYAKDVVNAEMGKTLSDSGIEILNIIPVEYLKKTVPEKLKIALNEIGFKGTLPDEGVVFVLYRKDGKKFLIQIAEKGKVAPADLPGYEWVVSDKYAVKYLPEDYSGEGHGPQTTVNVSLDTVFSDEAREETADDQNVAPDDVEAYERDLHHSVCQDFSETSRGVGGVMTLIYNSNYITRLEDLENGSPRIRKLAEMSLGGIPSMEEVKVQLLSIITEDDENYSSALNYLLRHNISKQEIFDSARDGLIIVYNGNMVVVKTQQPQYDHALHIRRSVINIFEELGICDETARVFLIEAIKREPDNSLRNSIISFLGNFQAGKRQLTSIPAEMVDKLIKNGGQILRGFLADLAARDALPEDIKNIEGLDKVVAEFKTNPENFTDEMLIKRKGHVRIEIRGRLKSGDAAQIAIIGIPGDRRNPLTEALQKVAAGLSVSSGGFMTIDINVQNVDKALAIQFIDNELESILDRVGYQPGPLIDARTKRSVLMTDFNKTIVPHSKALLIDSAARDDLLGYLRMGGFCVLISANELEQTIRRVVDKDGLPNDVRRNLIIIANGGSQLVMFDKTGNPVEMEDYRAIALSKFVPGKTVTGLDAIYLGDDERPDAKDFAGFRTMIDPNGKNRAVTVSAKARNEVPSELRSNYIGGREIGSGSLLRAITEFVRQHPKQAIFADLSQIVNRAREILQPALSRRLERAQEQTIKIDVRPDESAVDAGAGSIVDVQNITQADLPDFWNGMKLFHKPLSRWHANRIKIDVGDDGFKEIEAGVPAGIDIYIGESGLPGWVSSDGWNPQLIEPSPSLTSRNEWGVKIYRLQKGPEIRYIFSGIKSNHELYHYLGMLKVMGFPVEKIRVSRPEGFSLRDFYRDKFNGKFANISHVIIGLKSFIGTVEPGKEAAGQYDKLLIGQLMSKGWKAREELSTPMYVVLERNGIRILIACLDTMIGDACALFMDELYDQGVRNYTFWGTVGGYRAFGKHYIPVRPVGREVANFYKEGKVALPPNVDIQQGDEINIIDVYDVFDDTSSVRDSFEAQEMELYDVALWLQRKPDARLGLYLNLSDVSNEKEGEFSGYYAQLPREERSRERSGQIDSRVKEIIGKIEPEGLRGAQPESEKVSGATQLLGIVENVVNNEREMFGADSIVGACIVLARRAKSQNQKLIIGLETDWIPGYNEKGSYQQNAISSLVNEVVSLDKTLRSMGLDNVVILHRGKDELARAVSDEATKTNTKLTNVVLFGSNATLNSDAFNALRSTPTEARAFLASVDPSEIKPFYDEHKDSMKEQLRIRLIEMLCIALELAVGKDMPPQLPIKTSYDKTLRTVTFLPKAEPVDYETLRNTYMSERAALEAA